MEHIKDFSHYQSLIDKEKKEEDSLQKFYLKHGKNYLLNLNNFRDSKFKFHKNVCFGIV